MSTRNELDVFAQQGREALDAFRTVPDSNVAGGYIHAEADTGSRYEVYAMDAQGADAGVGAKMVFVVYPRGLSGSYAVRGGKMHPVYFLEKFSSRGQSLRENHGGDVYAVLECIAQLTGGDYVQPEGL